MKSLYQYKEILPSNVLYHLEKCFSKGYYKKEYNCSSLLFVHIPKNAGCSVNKMLYGVDHLGHNSLRDRYAFDTEFYNSKFKFCVKRNPFERFISAFNFSSSGGFQISQNSKNVIKAIKKYPDINDFTCHWFAYQNLDVIDHVFRSQSYYVADQNGNLLVDKVYDMDMLDTDFFRVLSQDSGEKILTRFPKRNKTKTSNSYLGKIILSDYTKEIIRQKYADDFKIFGF